MKIYNRVTEEIIFDSAYNTMRETLESAIKFKADLSGANLSGANLSGAETGLEIIPMPSIKADICAKICATPENLEMSTWHTCDTVHCLAGWAVTLHPQGLELEEKYGTNAAAALIFYASGIEKIPDFYSDNETAMKWLKETSEK